MDNRLISETKDYSFKDLEKVKPVVYKIKNSDREHLGLIAQELASVEPLLVKRNEGILDVDYQKLSVLVLSVLKQVQERVAILEANQKITITAKVDPGEIYLLDNGAKNKRKK